jgi:uncharacterized protein YndB with AHSA1/START domain
MNDTIERSETHAIFVVERSYDAPLERVWEALTDNDARDQWFTGGSEFTANEKSHAFSVGGHGTEEGQWHGGPHSRFVSTYTDIVEHQRFVFTYDMWIDGRHISTSLTTIAVEPDGAGTRLTYTEQGVHLDGLGLRVDRGGWRRFAAARVNSLSGGSCRAAPRGASGSRGGQASPLRHAGQPGTARPYRD